MQGRIAEVYNFDDSYLYNNNVGIIVKYNANKKLINIIYNSLNVIR